MPFSSQARIALVADSPLNNVEWNVGTEPFADPPRWWGTFHATYTQIPHPQPGQDMTFLDVNGSGKLVGTVINFSAPTSIWIMLLPAHGTTLGPRRARVGTEIFAVGVMKIFLFQPR